MSANNPFQVDTTLPFVAILGERNGYVQVACSRTQEKYQHLNGHVLRVALDWCRRAELEGAERVYWITLSEMVRHLHIHLYPRWEADTIKGIALFEARNDDDQPAWTPALSRQVQEWARRHDVHIINPQMLYNRPARPIANDSIATDPTPALLPVTETFCEPATESIPSHEPQATTEPPMVLSGLNAELMSEAESTEALPTHSSTLKDEPSSTESGFWNQVRQSPLSAGGGVLGLAGLATAFTSNQTSNPAGEGATTDPYYPPSSVSPLDRTTLDEPLPHLEVASLLPADGASVPMALSGDHEEASVSELTELTPVLGYAPGPWADQAPLFQEASEPVTQLPPIEPLLSVMVDSTDSQVMVPDEMVSPVERQVDLVEALPNPNRQEPMLTLPPAVAETVQPVDVLPVVASPHYSVTQPVMPIALTAHWKAKPKAAAAKYGHAPISYPVWMINHSRHVNLMAQASQQPQPAPV